MEFIHQPYQPGETIAAIATAPGEGGVAVIRISGKLALEVSRKVFSRKELKFCSHRAYYGHIVNSGGDKIDDVLLLPMLGPKSYTGEDTVEIFCHGGSLITRRVLEVVLQAGARAALPGEFTFKAYMSGRLDLSQAEAVQELISAKNEWAVNAAGNQLDGSLSIKVADFQEKLTLIAAILEAWVDFPEEGLEFTSMDEIIQDIEAVKEQIKKLIQSFHEGKIVHEGLSLCLIGAPNVGKSSLMNVLLDKERAIVSEIPGTTRDILEDHMRLGGLNVKILDTAGIRETEETIEKEGIRRSLGAIKEADLVLVVLDIHEATPPFLSQIPQHKTVIVWNKADLPHDPVMLSSFSHQVVVSALKKMGIEDLKKAIEKVIWEKGPPSKEEIVITNVRHKEALVESSNYLKSLVEGLKQGISPEFLTLEIRGALRALGKILGTDISEDVLTAIFSKFCIGK